MQSRLPEAETQAECRASSASRQRETGSGRSDGANERSAPSKSEAVAVEGTKPEDEGAGDSAAARSERLSPWLHLWDASKISAAPAKEAAATVAWSNSNVATSNRESS